MEKCANRNLKPANKLLIPLLASLLTACSEQGGQQAAVALPQPDSKAALLYKEKCSACHTVPLPSKHPARLWPSVLQRMQMRMKSKGVKKLNREELELILEYLQKHAKGK